MQMRNIRNVNIFICIKKEVTTDICVIDEVNMGRYDKYMNVIILLTMQQKYF